MLITFSELRKIKDNLPDGSMKMIANKFNLEVETVRNYFGGSNYTKGESVGIHFEEGVFGCIVMLEDTAIFNMAKDILNKN